MSDIAISIENISKLYRLGSVGTQSLHGDLKRWWSRVTGKEDPFQKIGVSNDLKSKDKNDYVWALKDINFSIKQGEVVGIIGKNGAGKSTLLKILSRVTTPTTGQIKVNGRIASLLEVGTGFHPELTGRENIFLNGSILGMTKTEIRSKFDEIVDFSGVEKYIDTPVKRYSSGMYVRLAFAVAAHLEPEILIVDEVLAVGDAEFQKKALGKMQDVSKGDGRTVLFVSHNMAAIQNLCSTGVVMENGMTKFTGDINESVEYYLSKQEGNLNPTEKIEYSKNRSGNGHVQFADFYLESSGGYKIDSVLTGQDIILVFVLKVNKPTVENVDISFSFHNMQDLGLGNLYSSYHNKLYNLTEGYTEIRCSVPNFPFTPGRILVGGRILENGIEADWCKDKLGSIDIQMGDFYRTGIIGQTNWGQYLISAKWL